jgi:2,3-bisphosphoglycerate-dependent phosphoglycerate mutase
MKKLRQNKSRLNVIIRALIALSFCLIQQFTVGLSTAPSSSSSSSSSSSQTQTTNTDNRGEKDNSFVHTLLLCRHGDSIWNGGEPGCRETFTGWTNVPLSQKGIREAQATGRQVAEYELGIDACFTSILQRAQLTAHYCWWGFGEKANTDSVAPRAYIQDYRLNERHYGALQGLVKDDVEQGLYGHDPALVQQWRRSWYTVPPLLEDDEDPRRQQEVKAFANHCGGAQCVPRGESLEQVADQRIRPFLKEKLCPVLQDAAASRTNNDQGVNDEQVDNHDKVLRSGGTGLVVAHANSLRALIGVICNVQEDPIALEKLEGLRLQTGVPLVLRFQYYDSQTTTTTTHDECNKCNIYQPCTMEGIPFVNPNSSNNKNRGETIRKCNRGLVPELPVYPLSSIPMKPAPGTSSARSTTTTTTTTSNKKILTVPF